MAVASIPGVPAKVLEDWLAVRIDKKAGTLTETAVEGLQREAAKAGLSMEEAVRYCVVANWIGFNAGFYANRERSSAPMGAPINKQEALEAANQEVARRFLANRGQLQ